MEMNMWTGKDYENFEGVVRQKMGDIRGIPEGFGLISMSNITFDSSREFARHQSEQSRGARRNTSGRLLS